MQCEACEASEYLELILAAAESASAPRIVQLCVRDHSTQLSPHVHVQAHIRGDDGEVESSEWTRLGDMTLEDLHAAALSHTLRHHGDNATAIRFHMHDDEPTTAPVAEDLLVRLWSCSHALSNKDAVALALEGKGTCSICLSDISDGEEAAFLPCDGEHALHFACMRTWLEKASTCPSCRFQLPTQARAEAEANAIDALVDKSLAAMARLKAASLKTSQTPRGRPTSAACATLIADLTNRAEALEDQLRCDVCEDAPKAVAFQCGHRFCESCAERVQTCPSCRREVTLRIRCFD